MRNLESGRKYIIMYKKLTPEEFGKKKTKL